jgi:hypothetical protein
MATSTSKQGIWTNQNAHAPISFNDVNELVLGAVLHDAHICGKASNGG